MSRIQPKQVKWDTSTLNNDSHFGNSEAVDWLSEVLSKCGRFRLRRWAKDWGNGHEWLVEIREDASNSFQMSRTVSYSTLKAAKQRCQCTSDEWAKSTRRRQRS